MKKTFILGLCLLFIFLLTNCPEKLENPDDDGNDNGNTDPGEIEPEIDLMDGIIAIINQQEGTLDNPAFLKLEIDLGIMSNPESNWKIILEAIEKTEKYIDLDLSNCILESQSYSYFFPDFAVSTGKDKIVSLILPDTITDITGGTGESNSAFKHFTNLKHASGKNIIHIGNWAFYNCTKLEEANFPNVTEINLGVFYNCINLKEANFPEAVEIISNAFRNCKNLVSVSAPKVETIGTLAFYDCTSLAEINLSAVTKIYQNAFGNCLNLAKADFPLVITLGNQAFDNCIKLETVLFPKVEVIHSRTFFNCVNLKETDFSSVVHIADHAFYNCTSLEEIIFPKAMIIEPMSFGNCTSLTTARFLADPDPAKDSNSQPIHPLSPWLKQEPTLPCVSESLLFYNEAFNGCTSLITLDVRNAWNVYFAGNALNNIGETLVIYLYDDDGVLDNNGEIKPNYTGKSYGHPQLDNYLGAVSLKLIKIIAPNGTQLEKFLPNKAGYPGLFSDIKSRYSGNVTVMPIERN